MNYDLTFQSQFVLRISPMKNLNRNTNIVIPQLQNFTAIIDILKNVLFFLIKIISTKSTTLTATIITIFILIIQQIMLFVMFLHPQNKLICELSISIRWHNDVSDYKAAVKTFPEGSEDVKHTWVKIISKDKINTDSTKELFCCATCVQSLLFYAGTSGQYIRNINNSDHENDKKQKSLEQALVEGFHLYSITEAQTESHYWALCCKQETEVNSTESGSSNNACQHDSCCSITTVLISDIGSCFNDVTTQPSDVQLWWGHSSLTRWIIQNISCWVRFKRRDCVSVNGCVVTEEIGKHLWREESTWQIPKWNLKYQNNPSTSTRLLPVFAHWRTAVIVLQHVTQRLIQNLSLRLGGIC